MMSKLKFLIKAFTTVIIPSVLLGCAYHINTPENSSTVTLKSANKDINFPNEYSVKNQIQSGKTVALNTQSLLNGFDNPELQNLISTALTHNPDLAATATRVLDAHSRTKAAKLQRFPNLNLSTNAGRSKNNLGFTTFTSNSFSLNVNTQWELDIWNKLGNQAKASALELNASKNDLVFAQLSLAANISRAYFNVLTEKALLKQIQESTDNIKKLEAIAVRSFKRGLVTALDVQLARRDLANAQSTYFAQKNAVNNSARTLSLLLGEYPNANKLVTQISDTSLPELSANLASGIPSNVLNLRPDLLASQSRLVAADLQARVARKNLLPSINLTGSAGTSSTELSDLLDKDFSAWSILGNLTYPLLNRQTLKTNVDLAENSLERLTYNYASQVLTAFNEVESGLDGETTLRIQYTKLSEARDYAQASSERAKKSYEKGLVEANTLLSTELQLRSAEQSLIRTKNQLLQNRINLILALGGGLKVNNTQLSNTPFEIVNQKSVLATSGETL